MENDTKHLPSFYDDLGLSFDLFEWLAPTIIREQFFRLYELVCVKEEEAGDLTLKEQTSIYVMSIDTLSLEEAKRLFSNIVFPYRIADVREATPTF